MKLSKEDVFRTDIIQELTILKDIDENFLSKIRDISLEDLIYLKLFLAYSNLNAKFLKGLPIGEVIGSIVESVMTKFVTHFEEKE